MEESKSDLALKWTFCLGQEEKMENKEVIRAFYDEFFNKHDVDSADKYVRKDYIKHHPWVNHGREALKQAFADTFKDHT